MIYWLIIFLVDLLYSLVMIWGGSYMVKHADGNINYFIGYRSSLSLKNKDTWKFANEDCGKRWLKIGKIMLVPTILVHIPVYGKGDARIGWLSLVICIIECTVMILSIVPTEKALKENFTVDGKKIEK